jgi:hypothetical protein
MLEIILKRSLQIRQFLPKPNLDIHPTTLRLPPALRNIRLVVRSLVKTAISVHVQLQVVPVKVVVRLGFGRPFVKVERGQPWKVSRMFYPNKTAIKYIPPLGRGGLMVWVEQDGRKIAEGQLIDTSSLITVTNGAKVKMEVTRWDGKFRE